MFSEKKYPDYLSPEELDGYLCRGWYRMGQSIFTTHFLYFESQILNAIWIRLDLQDYTFSKSTRKNLRNCLNQFEVTYQPFEFNKEKENLYQIYRQDFPGLISPTLRESLYEVYDVNVFNSWELTIRDQGKLIAFSVFDLGEKSLASIVGVYHPAYKKYSLGLSTLLLEVKFGIENGFQWFYPGYIVPGNSRFDYKLRIGQTQAYDIYTHSWLPTSIVLSQTLPLEKLQEKILQLSHFFSELGVQHKVVLNMLPEANFYASEEMTFIDDPCYIFLYDMASELENSSVITYNLSKDTYDLYRCTPLKGWNDNYWLVVLSKDQILVYIAALLIREKHTGSAKSRAEIFHLSLAEQSFRSGE